MVKIFVLLLILLMAFDGIFREGELITVFLSHNFYIPFFLKVIFAIIALLCTALLLHAVIWEYFLLPPPEIVKTPYQIQKEEEAKAEEERLEQERLEEEERKKKEEEENKGAERKYVRDDPQPDYNTRKKSKLG